MSYLGEYPRAMDWVRERLGLPSTTDLYELTVKMVGEIKSLDEQLKNSNRRITNDGPTKRKRGRPRKSS